MCNNLPRNLRSWHENFVDDYANFMIFICAIATVGALIIVAVMFAIMVTKVCYG